MQEQNKALVKRWFEEVWNQGREATIDELFDTSSIAHGLGETDAIVRGPDAFKPFVRNLRSSFPDLHIRVDDLVAEDDRVAVRVSLEGTHHGNGLGIAPTGRRVRVSGILIVRFANGRIAEGWNCWDKLGLMQQLEAVPGPPQGKDTFLSPRE
jgi:steroid delta-isomerase-like uncharacterized protein